MYKLRMRNLSTNMTQVPIAFLELWDLDIITGYQILFRNYKTLSEF